MVPRSGHATFNFGSLPTLQLGGGDWLGHCVKMTNDFWGDSKEVDATTEKSCPLSIFNLGKKC